MQPSQARTQRARRRPPPSQTATSYHRRAQRTRRLQQALPPGHPISSLARLDVRGHIVAATEGHIVRITAEQMAKRVRSVDTGDSAAVCTLTLPIAGLVDERLGTHAAVDAVIKSAAAHAGRTGGSIPRTSAVAAVTSGRRRRDERQSGSTVKNVDDSGSRGWHASLAAGCNKVCHPPTHTRDLSGDHVPTALVRQTLPPLYQVPFTPYAPVIYRTSQHAQLAPHSQGARNETHTCSSCMTA